MAVIQIERVALLPEAELASHLAASEAEGFRFVRRLIDEWRSAANRFDQAGEGFFTARLDGRLVGFCGLNQDPFASTSNVGRIRRFYVSAECRRLGVGQLLVQAIVDAARPHFTQLSLRTDNPAAARLYERLGFIPFTGVDHCTHLLVLEAIS